MAGGDPHGRVRALLGNKVATRDAMMAWEVRKEDK